MIENQAAELFSIQKSCDSVVALACNLLGQHGLQVTRSFDLQVARTNQNQCSCPNHGTGSCDCQMIILLIYGIQDVPATLVAHGHDGWTYLSLVDHPGQKISPGSVSIIKDILLPAQLIN